MKKLDARKLPKEAQQHNRDQAIRLFHQGKTRKEIASIVGVHYVVVCGWIRAWQQGGDAAITLKKRGRGSEEQRLLTMAQEIALKQLLCDKNPKQLKLPFALWNRKAIQSVIYQMWRVRIAIRTIGDYVKRWGFTPQKPAKRAYERNPKVVQKWLDETYPEIKRRARKENAEIYWGDETGVRNDCQHSRGYAPRGKTPIVEINAKRFSITYNPTSLTGIWAEENSREAIFNALQRKEVFATSGTRISVRFFASFDYPSNLAEYRKKKMLQEAYQKGTPMGRVIGQKDSPNKEQSPRFLVWATKDPLSANLQRIQIVKGWEDANGTHEQVYDVTFSDGVMADKNNRCLDNGAEVDLKSFKYSWYGIP